LRGDPDLNLQDSFTYQPFNLKLHIKYMVSNRCKLTVREILKNMQLHFVVIDLGEVDVMEELDAEQIEFLRQELKQSGLELMDDKKAILIEKIKTTVIEMVHYTDELLKTNFSTFLSEKLGYNYTYLANLFSEIQGSTIEQFIILHKVERIKELIFYGELNITEIAYNMNYSSVAHLSSQFKKVTGLSPSHFKQLKDKKRMPIEEVGMVGIVREASNLGDGMVEEDLDPGSYLMVHQDSNQGELKHGHK